MALSFAQVCLQRATATDGSELEEPFDAAEGALWDQDRGEEDRKNWILEARTWELIHILCGDRFLRDEDRDIAPRGFYQTPLSAVQDIFERDRELRELKVNADAAGLRRTPLRDPCHCMLTISSSGLHPRL